MKKCKPAENTEPCAATEQDPLRIEIEATWNAMNYGKVTLSHNDEIFAMFGFGPGTPIKDYAAAIDVVEFIKSKFQP